MKTQPAFGSASSSFPEAVAKANVAAKAKTQKQIVRDCLAGTHGRPKVSGWLEFPARGIGHACSASVPDADLGIEPERMAAE
jgi:hypothetical protein